MESRHVVKLACLLAALLALAPAGAGALLDWESPGWSASLDGSARSFLFLQRWSEDGLLPGRREAVSLTRIRAEGGLRIGEGLSIELAYDLSAVLSAASALTGGASAEELALQSASPLRLADLDVEVERGENYRLLQNLDRASLSWRLPGAELALGRQAVTLGRALLISPLDLFAPFSPAALDTEYKRGVDALRLTVPIGLRSEAELIAASGEDPEGDGVYLARWHSAWGPGELGLLAGACYREPSFGLSLAGDLAGTGLYAEALYRAGREREDVLRASAGLWRQLNPTWSATLELHFSGAGEAEPADYYDTMQSPEWTHGELFLLGRHYAALSLSWQARPLLALQALWLQNLGDGSALVEPTLAWDFGENTALGLGAAIGIGEAPEPAIPFGLPEIRSEFGLIPDSYFAEIRVYF